MPGLCWLLPASRSETRMRLNVGDNETAAASEGFDLGRCATLLLSLRLASSHGTRRLVLSRRTLKLVS